MSSRPIVAHWAPWPVNIKARRGSDVVLVATGFKASAFRKLEQQSAMANDLHP